jgi:hypothetical protein
MVFFSACNCTVAAGNYEAAFDLSEIRYLQLLLISGAAVNDANIARCVANKSRISCCTCRRGQSREGLQF